ncbi:hypothetical protein E2C01_041075 [Portunus trituberculatus]|uniref:Uncharacterized protein n=1 Tax=Portunus trituberculatus TaxID=210409 RepID=A0A5B7FQH2_PORTR|nr:hypothetical protein [Portunus trituberculatus]
MGDEEEEEEEKEKRVWVVGEGLMTNPLSRRARVLRALNDLTLILPSGYFETQQEFVYSVRSLLLTPPPTILAINLLIGATC